ncbi:putative methyltransferase DDB_G0268948 [Branchiostoma lanceolatum]|uniref:putative methyltransferase DDB_G0268948 n=1 Tax=Branchiostoma lanceolatum TaxID=7740 RepID=UPI003455FF8A
MVFLKSLLRTSRHNLFFRADLLKGSGCVEKNIWRKMTVRLYEEADHAESYQKFRPTYGQELAEKIVAFVKEKKTTSLNQAVDIGCGSGQSTIILAPHFQQVTGIDISEAQIAMATAQNKFNNVQYRVGHAEHIPLPDSSVDLVSCGTSAHWFDFPKFHKEVDRVLRPLGCLAVYTYGINYLSYKDTTAELNRIFLEFKYDSPIRDHWHEKRWHIDDNYQHIPMPYKGNVRDDSMTIEVDYPLPGYIGYLSTWSAYREYCRHNPEDKGAILQKLQQRLYEAVKTTKPPEEVILHVSYPVVLLMARKPHMEQTSA